MVLGFVVGAVTVVLVGGGAVWLMYGPQLAPSVTPVAAFSAQELRGERIYNADCASCHGGATGGGMEDYPPRHNANGHTWHHPDCQLARIIREGGDEMTASMRDTMAPPGASPMPAFKDRLSSADIDAVLSYMKRLWTAQQRSVQAQVTREICVG
jgi:mono/diheme cytochrome c family protein